MSAIGKWLVGLALTAVAVTVSYQWLDRPLALAAHALAPAHKHMLFEPLTHIPDPLIPAAAIAFVALGLAALAGRTLTRLTCVVLIASFSLVMGEAVKNELKFLFGRTWPETWVHDNPSFIRDHTFGFNWLHGGAGYMSFPSGHMTATCALLSVLWICYPRFRALYVLAALAVVVGLLGANFHFLSDVIAGGFVGISVGWMSVTLFEWLSGDGR